MTLHSCSWTSIKRCVYGTSSPSTTSQVPECKAGGAGVGNPHSVNTRRKIPPPGRGCLAAPITAAHTRPRPPTPSPPTRALRLQRQRRHAPLLHKCHVLAALAGSHHLQAPQPAAGRGVYEVEVSCSRGAGGGVAEGQGGGCGTIMSRQAECHMPHAAPAACLCVPSS